VTPGDTVRIGLAGYGRGGRFFHAPLIGLAPECTLAGVLTRSAQLLGGIRGPLKAPVRDAFLGPTARREKPEVVATVNELAAKVNITSGRHAVTSVVPRRPDQRELFGTIRTPVLVVAGGEDPTFPPAESEQMADAIPGARFVVLEQSAHLAALESPEEVNALIDDFLADQGAAY